MSVFKNIDENEMKKKIESRINEMENPNYEFPKRMDKKDYLVAISMMIFCFVMIILGYYL